MAFTHRYITTPTELEAERDTWDGVVRDRYEGNPFVSLDWNLTWLRHFVPAGGMRYVRVDGPAGAAAAYFPFITCVERFHGAKVRVLRFAGNLYSPITCPIVATAGGLAPALDYVADKVLPEINWSVMKLDRLPPGPAEASGLCDALRKQGYDVFQDGVVANWVYDAPGITSDAYFRQLKYNLRSDTKRFPKKLAAIGTVRYRLAAADLARADVDAYKLVYARSWKEPEFEPDFHPAFMEVAARRGWLRLALLFVDDRPIAAQLWLISEGRGYVVKIAYDQEFRAYSPGTLLSWWVIQQLMDAEHLQFFDYLWGDEDYKKHWTNHRREQPSLIVFGKGWAGRGWRVLDRRLLPWVRRQTHLNRVKASLARLVRGRQGGE